MADVLRLLAVHVAEPDPGQFEWVITERVNEDRWREIHRAEDGYKTYKSAMANGLVALEEMISDLDVGPREQSAQTDVRQSASKVPGQPPQLEQNAPASQIKPKTADYFGFGPVR